MPFSGPGPFLGAQADTAYQVSRSLRFRSSASAYLSRTQGAATNGFIWTWSAWVKRGSLGSNQVLFCAGAPSNTQGVQFIATDVIQIFRYTGTYTVQLDTTQVFRDPSSWYHLVVANDGTQATASNRIKFYVNGTQVTSFTTATYPAQNTQYEINNNYLTTIGKSFDNFYADYYLTEVNFIDGQALTPSSFGAYDTNGVWQPKAYTGTYGTNGFYLPFSDNTNANTLCYDRAGSNTVVSTAAYFTPTGGVSQSSLNLVGPLSQLYDGVTTGQTTMYNNPVNSILQVDAGAGNTLDLTRWGFFLRNAFASETWSIQYSDDNSTWTNAKTGFQVSTAGWNDTTFTSVGAHRYWRAIVTTQVNGEYVTEYRLYGTGTYRTANDWTPNNISVATGTTYDSMIDSPTNYADGGNGRGNYATLNPLYYDATFNYRTLYNGNLTTVGITAAANNGNDYSTQTMKTGKWYAEFTCSGVLSTYPQVGIVDVTSVKNGQGQVGYVANSCGYFADGSKSVNGTGSAYGSSYTTNDVIAVAVDADNGAIYFGKVSSGTITWQNSGVPTSGSSKTGAASTWTGGSIEFYFALAVYRSSGWDANFGQRPFSASALPSGFSALNTQNLPAPALTPSP
jgi:hypothetical protein